MAIVESFSGIRGIYGKDLTESNAIKYAYGYLSFLKNRTKKNVPTVVIGTDTRPSGASLSKAVMSILDCNFIDIGIAPTPAIEFAVRYFNADGGVIITASHNEPYWNGFKFLQSTGAILEEPQMNLVLENSGRLKDFHKIQQRTISEKNSEAVKKYAEFVFSLIGMENVSKIKSSKQKIVIDPNGGTGIIAKKMLENAGAETTGINMKYGEFNRAVEPNEDSLVYLKNIIDEQKADFAAGFDCDADRVEIMLETGQMVSGNYILALITDSVLSSLENPKGKSVVINDATSNVVRDVARKYGAKIIETEVGETNVVKAMETTKAVIGGEGSSGGVIIPPSKCRDGILTLLMALSIIANRKKKLGELIGELPEYCTLRKKIEYDSSKHNQIKKFLKEHYLKQGFELKEAQGTKGSLKIITGKNSFVWFRASKTESGIFRIISDSDSKQEAEKLLEEAAKLFGKANE